MTIPTSIRGLDSWGENNVCLKIRRLPEQFGPYAQIEHIGTQGVYVFSFSRRNSDCGCSLIRTEDLQLALHRVVHWCDIGFNVKHCVLDKALDFEIAYCTCHLSLALVDSAPDRIFILGGSSRLDSVLRLGTHVIQRLSERISCCIMHKANPKDIL